MYRKISLSGDYHNPVFCTLFCTFSRIGDLSDRKEASAGFTLCRVYVEVDTLKRKFAEQPV